MNVLLAEETIKNGKNAGSKARKDVKDILMNKGYKFITLYKSETLRIIEILSVFIGFVKTFFAIKKNNNLIVEHPYTPIFFSKCLAVYATLLHRIKKIHTVIIIHDINCIRFGNKDFQEEIDVFNKYEYVICHNEKMHEWLKKNGCNSDIIELGIFDYICNLKETKRSVTDDLNSIIIAGNLSYDKSGYIYSLPKFETIVFNLYGVGVDENRLNINCFYKGIFSPEELPEVINGKYGLVWDGESCLDCIGLCGEYLKINNPHKLSLFLVAGIPVIVWRKAAVAKWVTENKVGICVDTLNSLEDTLKNISSEEYTQMIKNINKLRKKIQKGKNLAFAINSIKNKEENT